MLCSMALPSKLGAALHVQTNVSSMCDCKPCRSLDSSVLVDIYQELTVIIVQEGVQGPEGTTVSTQGQHHVQ